MPFDERQERRCAERAKVMCEVGWITHSHEQAHRRERDDQLGLVPRVAEGALRRRPLDLGVLFAGIAHTGLIRGGVHLDRQGRLDGENLEEIGELLLAHRAERIRRNVCGEVTAIEEV